MVTLLFRAIAAGCGQRSFSRRVGVDIAWSSVAAAEEPANASTRVAIVNEPRSQTRNLGTRLKGPKLPDTCNSRNYSRLPQ